jgi:hypothetical protein
MKLVNTKQDLRNQYGTYSGNTIVGNYPINTIDLDVTDIGDITPVPGTFRVIFSVDGQLYGSSTLLSEIQSSGNPYINKSSLPIVELNSKDLTSDVETFTARENYAEVSVTENLNSVEDFAKHISWLLDSSQKELRKPSQDYGAYSVSISSYSPETDSGLGFEFSEQAQKPID